MSLADSTVHNQVRRKIASVMENLVNDCGETLIFQNYNIANGEKLFNTVRTGRVHKSEIKSDNFPLLYFTTGETSFTGHNNRALSQTRGVRCYVIMRKAVNNIETDTQSIEDTLDYYRKKIVKELTSTHRQWLNGRLSLAVTGADDTDTIEQLNMDWQYPFYSAVVDAVFVLPSGNL